MSQEASPLRNARESKVVAGALLGRLLSRNLHVSGEGARRAAMKMWEWWEAGRA